MWCSARITPPRPWNATRRCRSAPRRTCWSCSTACWIRDTSSTLKPCPIDAMPDPRRVAVIQPLPGIGDMIWHLPHIRAVARWFGRPVTLVAKPRSAADELFSGEQTIEDVLWLDRNPERRRGGHDGVGGFLRLVASLRQHAFDAVVV